MFSHCSIDVRRLCGSTAMLCFTIVCGASHANVCTDPPGQTGTYTCESIESEYNTSKSLKDGKTRAVCYCLDETCPPIEVEGLSFTWTDYDCGASQNGNQLQCDGMSNETPGGTGELGAHKGANKLPAGQKHYHRLCLCMTMTGWAYICDDPDPDPGQNWIICLNKSITHSTVETHTDRQCTGGGGDCTVEGCTDECD